MQEDSSSDSGDDEVYDKHQADRTHRVFDFKELKVGAEGRFEAVAAFSRILKRQGFVRIVLPEVIRNLSTRWRSRGFNLDAHSTPVAGGEVELRRCCGSR